MTILNPPTTCLPLTRKLQQATPNDLARALQYLRSIYNPEVRGVHRKRVHDDASPHTTKPDPSLDTLRSDPFERAYAIRWLTALVSYISECADAPDLASHELLLQQAASLLAICAGSAAAGTVTRAFRFEHGPAPFVVQLTDMPLENQDYGSVGAQTWGSACLLSDVIVQAPRMFGVGNGADHLRVLELGAGTGLVSLTIAKLLDESSTKPLSAEIVATDFHSSVLANLHGNIEVNFPGSVSSKVSISAHFLDWSQATAPFGGPFDLILGADIIYELKHASWIKNCIEAFLRKPNVPPISLPAQFHLVIPLRHTHTLESDTVEQVFPPLEVVRSSAPVSEPMLAIVSKDIIVCEAYGDVCSRGGYGDEVEYVHYCIAWA